MKTPPHPLQGFSKFITKQIAAISTLIIFGAMVFLITSRPPHNAELSFIEKSAFAKGSVIPASCDSAPPTSHFFGDCEPLVNLGVGADLSSFVDLSISVSSKNPAYGVQPALTWSSTGYTNCQLSQTAEGVTTNITTGLINPNYTLPYINNTGSGQEVIYQLRCTNTPDRDDTIGVRVWYDYNLGYSSTPVAPVTPPVTPPITPPAPVAQNNPACPPTLVEDKNGTTLYIVPGDGPGLLPNGHPYCRYQGAGAPTHAVYDITLGRGISYLAILHGWLGGYVPASNLSPAFMIYGPFNPHNKANTLAEVEPWIQVAPSLCVEDDFDWYVVRGDCASNAFAGAYYISELNSMNYINTRKSQGYLYDVAPQPGILGDYAITYGCKYSGDHLSAACMDALMLYKFPF